MMKKIIIAVLILIVIVAVTVFKVYNKPHINVTKTAPDISIFYKELINEFEADENKANSKYLDEIIQISGPISKIALERGKTIITIGEEELFGNIDCHMSSEEKDDFEKLKVGQEIKLKGVCTGYLLNVVLVRTVLTN